jgi:hypothetical protein
MSCLNPGALQGENERERKGRKDADEDERTPLHSSIFIPILWTNTCGDLLPAHRLSRRTIVEMMRLGAIASGSRSNLIFRLPGAKVPSLQIRP